MHSLFPLSSIHQLITVSAPPEGAALVTDRCATRLPAPVRRILFAAAAAASVAGCGEAVTPPEFHEPGIALIAGALADTVQAEPAQPLTFRVTGADGLPQPGLIVRFEVLPVRRGGYTVIPLEIRRPAELRFRSFVVDTTDARGRVAVQVRPGTAAGPFEMRVAVPELGYEHAVSYSIRPGSAGGIVAAPSDTAMYAGSVFPMRAAVVDPFGNARSDPVTFAALAGPVQVDGAGRVMATVIGRASLIARSGVWADTAHVSVVPHGWLAVQAYDPSNGGPTGITMLQLDGSEARVVAPGLDNRVLPRGFGWSADGEALYVPRDKRIHRVARNGAETVVGEFTGPVNGVRPSRDGAWIYFVLDNGSWPNTGIHRVRPDGSGLTRVGTPSEYGVRETSPSPSQDGRRMAYVSSGGQSTVRVWDIAAGRDTGVRVAGTRVAWSPVGDEIAYHDEARLRVMRPDGTLLRDLAALPGTPSALDWSPDGQWLVVSFVWGVPVTLVHAHTGTQLPLGYAASMGEAAWRP